MRDLKDVTAAILAGGMGIRLRSVVADRPKVLAEVGGRPFIAYLLDQLTTAGIRRVIVCTGHLGTQVQEMFGDTYGDLRVVYSHEPVPLGTAGALRLALPLLRSDPVLVMNGDSYCQVDLGAFWTWHRERAAEASLLLAEVPDTQRYGRVLVDATGRVLSFVEKGDGHGAGWINAGVYVLSHRVPETIPGDHAVSLEEEVFPAWIGRGLYGCRSNGRFVDIGTPHSYAVADEWFSTPGVVKKQEQPQ